MYEGVWTSLVVTASVVCALENDRSRKNARPNRRLNLRVRVKLHGSAVIVYEPPQNKMSGDDMFVTAMQVVALAAPHAPTVRSAPPTQECAVGPPHRTPAPPLRHPRPTPVPPPPLSGMLSCPPVPQVSQALPGLGSYSLLPPWLSCGLDVCVRHGRLPGVLLHGPNKDGRVSCLHNTLTQRQRTLRDNDPPAPSPHPIPIPGPPPLQLLTPGCGSEVIVCNHH